MHRRLRPEGASEFASLDVEVVESEGAELSSGLGMVVTAVEMQRFDLVQQADASNIAQGGFQQLDVVAVCSIDRPSQCDTVGVDRYRPFPTRFGSICGVGPVP